MRSLAEWVLALGLIWLTAWVGWPLLRGLALPPSGTFALVESPLPALPIGVPAGAQSVPFLMFDSGAVIRRGMAETEVRSSTLEPLAEGAAQAEPGVFGERTVMPFRAGPSRFWVVLERTQIGREREVTAIYVR